MCIIRVIIYAYSCICHLTRYCVTRVILVFKNNILITCALILKVTQALGGDLWGIEHSVWPWVAHH